MIDLHFAPTGSGLRATVASNETGLPYRLHKLDLNKGEQRTPEFRKINPAGLIPVVVDGEAPGGNSPALNRSAPIVLYCAEKSGRFIPASAAWPTLIENNGARGLIEGYAERNARLEQLGLQNNIRQSGCIRRH